MREILLKLILPCQDRPAVTVFSCGFLESKKSTRWTKDIIDQDVIDKAPARMHPKYVAEQSLNDKDKHSRWREETERLTKGDVLSNFTPAKLWSAYGTCTIVDIDQRANRSLDDLDKQFLHEMIEASGSLTKMCHSINAQTA